MRSSYLIAFLVLTAALNAGRADGQVISQRGFAEGQASLFPEKTTTDSTRVVGDMLVREEVFAKPVAWLHSQSAPICG